MESISTTTSTKKVTDTKIKDIEKKKMLKMKLVKVLYRCHTHSHVCHSRV